MGILVDGKWVDESAAKSGDGKFVRPASVFRDRISREPGAKFPAVAGRYHLYVALNCPWASRTLIIRKLKNLEEAISISIVAPRRGDNGWEFTELPGCIPDSLYNSHYIYELYVRADPLYTGRVTVPVLWDKLAHTIVNNESSEIIEMLNNEFEGPDFYPPELRSKIDDINPWIYDKVNNGVYKAGFARNQEVYEQAVTEVFAALDQIEVILGNHRFLVGDVLTLADVRLFVTLIRFDSAYVGAFKCNLKCLRDYQNLSEYLRDIYQIPGIAETVNLEHIKSGYFNNGTRIVPKGPVIDFMQPHSRGAGNICTALTHIQ